MAYCSNCGAYISEGSEVCPACGKSVKENYENKSERFATGSAQQQYAQEKAQRASEEQRHTYENNRVNMDEAQRRQRDRKVYSGTVYNEGYEDDAHKNRLISLLSYFGILFLVPYLARRESEFAVFHANQGLILMLFNIAVGIVSNFILVGWLVGVVGWIFGAVCFFTGISNVLKCQMKELPLIGRFRLLK